MNKGKSRHFKMLRAYRRLRPLLKMGLFIFAAVVLLLLAYARWGEAATEQSSDNLLIFLLINLNIVFVCLAAILVGRRLVQLFLDRRRNILGARLRTKLVASFISIALIPTSLVFVLASGLIDNAIQGWFGNQIDSSLSASVEVGKQYFKLVRGQSIEAVNRLTGEYKGLSVADVVSKLEGGRGAGEFFSLALFTNKGRIVGNSAKALADIENFSEPPLMPSEIVNLAAREDKSRVDEVNDRQFVRVASPLTLREGSYILLGSGRIEPDLTHAIRVIKESLQEYEQTKFFKEPIKSGYILTLGLVTVLILFIAVWWGLFLARNVTEPVKRLAEGMTRLSSGNFKAEVDAAGDDEISFLARSFNQMVRDLFNSRRESDERRVYIESLVERLAVGVVRIAAGEVVLSANSAARDILQIDEQISLSNVSLRSALSSRVYEQVAPLLSLLESQEQHVLEREINVLTPAGERKVICTAGRVGPVDKDQGIVLLFDDITELSRAQHAIVWREVARRIAHEIKNPLTPIQLSAQRLLRMAGQAIPVELLTDCANTIVSNVASIKRLADEFSQFARMPTAELQSVDVNEIVNGVVEPFMAKFPVIQFERNLEPSVVLCMLDPEQIGRALYNIVDNGVAALVGEQRRDSEKMVIIVKTSVDPKANTFAIEVTDNGPGIPAADKARIFEPYFTTKSQGTGLGLAIVNSIVTEHQGEVRVFDSSPRGTRFVIKLPVTPRGGVQRRLGVGPKVP